MPEHILSPKIALSHKGLPTRLLHGYLYLLHLTHGALKTTTRTASPPVQPFLGERFALCCRTVVLSLLSVLSVCL